MTGSKLPTKRISCLRKKLRVKVWTSEPCAVMITRFPQTIPSKTAESVGTKNPSL
ncbi:MAG: hypothetical protein AAB332_05805 [Planctomycetota bacterium]